MGRGGGRGGGRAEVAPAAVDVTGKAAIARLAPEWREQRGKAVWVHDKGVTNERQIARMRLYTEAQVAEHNKPDDLWLIIKGNVYDISKWAKSHPGGHLCLENMAGADATDPFENYHPAYVWERTLPRFQIGAVATQYNTEFVQEWRALRQRLLAEGKYQTSGAFYLFQTLWLASLFATSLWLTLMEPSIGAHFLGAVFMAAFWQQLAFVGHDLGHNGVTHVKCIDNLIGICVGNLLGGISLGWWKWSHNVHHVVTNSVEHDPDIQHLPVFAVSPKIFKEFRSSFHDKLMVFDGVARALVRYQHLLYYPIMAVARFNLYAQSWILLASREKWQFKWLEGPALIGFMCWLGALLSTLPTWGEVAMFLLVSHGISGILHVQITLSHFSMDTYFGRPGFKSDEDNWFKMQLATSQDVDSFWYNEWFHGGLQYQIEHHLFPRLPRHNLKYARRLVREFARKHNVPYLSPCFFEANVDVVGSMKRAGALVKEYESGKEAFFKSMLWEGINARG